MNHPARDISVTGPIDARLAAPPSKSVTQRALILSALADGTSSLVDPLDSGDTRTLANALKTLGIPVHSGPRRWDVEGQAGRIPSGGAALDAGNAGTAARFLTALVALGHGRFVVDGSEMMRRRPIQALADALGELGVEARCRGADGCPPVEVMSRGLGGGTARVRGDQSSQYLSALLLVAPFAGSPVRLESDGRMMSLPYVRLTTEVMMAFGVAPREEGPLRYVLDSPLPCAGREFRVEGDYSSAGYFFAAAAITHGRVRVGNLRPDSAQADRGILGALETMGCKVAPEEDGWTVTGERLRGIDLDLAEMPDAAQTLAVVALFAEGPSRLRGLGTLRIKETDRIAAIAKEARKLGAEATEESDLLEIRPGRLRGADIETYGDHRMAMSFALAGLRIPGVRILDPGCVAKSFPSYWDEFDRLPGAPR